MTLTANTGTCVVTGMGTMTDVDVKLNLFLFTMLPKTLKGNIFGGDSSHVATPSSSACTNRGCSRSTRWSPDLLVGQHQRQLPGHARRQEHPRRYQVRRIGLVTGDGANCPPPSDNFLAFSAHLSRIGGHTWITRPGGPAPFRSARRMPAAAWSKFRRTPSRAPTRRDRALPPEARPGRLR